MNTTIKYRGNECYYFTRLGAQLEAALDALF